MPWSHQTKIHHLAQMHEESRYYRRFHHTVLSVAMAGYIGLIILQTNISDLLPNIPIISNGLQSIAVATTGIVLIILVIVPGFLTYLFVAYHFEQGSIRGNIYTLQKELGFPDRYLEDAKYEGFRDKPKRQKFCIGRGHKVFIALLWLMVFINLGVFLILSKLVTL